jgi:hypothetical protein
MVQGILVTTPLDDRSEVFESGGDDERGPSCSEVVGELAAKPRTPTTWCIMKTRHKMRG